MLCYHCGKNEAEYKIFVNYMGHAGEVNICSECMGRMEQYIGAMYRRARQSVEVSGATPFMPPFPPTERGRPEGGAFPADAGEEIRRRRKLGELNARLRAAIRQEDYEGAAALRDEINRVTRTRSEKGVLL